MSDCKYRKNEVTDGIKHEICTNAELKEINKSSSNGIPCMNNQCGKFEKSYSEENTQK